MRWVVELGRIDIIKEVSELPSFLALPHEGHLDAVFHLFNYLEKRHNARIVFNASYPVIDMSSFKDELDWRDHFMGRHMKPYHQTPRRPVVKTST